MDRSSRDTCTRSISWLAALACFAMGARGQDQAALRVCADPANLPLSNTRGEGYENKIAEMLARDLKRHVEFTFFPQRMGFVRNTLRQKDEVTQQFKCDVIIGVPKGFELTATTQPYMRSTYALVFKSRPEFAQLESPEDLVKLPPAQYARAAGPSLRVTRSGVCLWNRANRSFSRYSMASVSSVDDPSLGT